MNLKNFYVCLYTQSVILDSVDLFEFWFHHSKWPCRHYLYINHTSGVPCKVLKFGEFEKVTEGRDQRDRSTIPPLPFQIKKKSLRQITFCDCRGLVEDFTTKNFMYQSYKSETPNIPSRWPEKYPWIQKLKIQPEIYTFQHIPLVLFCHNFLLLVYWNIYQYLKVIFNYWNKFQLYI